ncbi:hypothetical protein KZF99_004469 [Salmonella enterica]|nr:hypothetical protein [Salmonella enterica]ELY6001068.1 hypothetical protein [Salmonella enterica]
MRCTVSGPAGCVRRYHGMCWMHWSGRGTVTLTGVGSNNKRHNDGEKIRMKLYQRVLSVTGLLMVLAGTGQNNE